MEWEARSCTNKIIGSEAALWIGHMKFLFLFHHVGREKRNNLMWMVLGKDVIDARVGIVEWLLNGVVCVIVIHSVIKQSQWPSNQTIAAANNSQLTC